MRGTGLVYFALIMLMLTSACQRPTEVPWSSEIEGSVFEVQVEYQNKSSGDGTTGSSSGRNTLTERIIEVDSKEIIVEYDYAPRPRRYVDEQPNLIEWEFPATISLKHSDDITLQNIEEITARNTEWREAAGIPNEACGLWYFTWNAFKVECDPNTVIQSLEAFILFDDEIHEGQEIKEFGTLKTGIIKLVSSSPLTFQAEFEFDPEVIRESRAEQDVIVAQMMQRETISLENALEGRATEQISGNLTATWELDDRGRVIKRTRNSNITIELENGEIEKLSQKQTTTRTLQAD